MAKFVFPKIWFFFFLLAIAHSSAQTQKLDSLKVLLETADDTTQVNVLRWMGKYSRSIDKQKALEYGLQSLDKSKEIGFIKGEIMALYDLGLTHGMTGSYAESLGYLRQCQELSSQENNHRYMKMVYNALGIVYKEIGNYTTSKEYYLKSIRLVDSLNLPYSISSSYSNLGILYDLMGEQDKAVESYKKALEVYKGQDREDLENNVLHNLAIIDKGNKNYESALSKYLKVVEFNLERNDKVVLAGAYLNIANCYIELKKWDQAESSLEKAMELAQQLSLRQLKPTIYLSKADLMLRQKHYKEALDFSRKNLALLDESGFQSKKEGHEMAYEIHEASGNLSQAVYHLNKTMAYKDSLLNETKVKEIQNLQIQHDIYLKDKEIKENELQLALLNTEMSSNNRRFVYLLIITILLLLSAVLFYFLYSDKKKSNEVFREKNELISKQNQTIEKINAELEKRMLRAQMNPHFIFNSLNSIQHLIINSTDKTDSLKYLTKFSKLLRSVLESSVNLNLLLREEIELLKIYLELESLRFDNAFSFNIVVDENLDVEEHEIPLLLVQPYVENAIVHGLMPKEGSKELTITFNNLEEYIECIVEDNGVGIYSGKTESEKSKGPSRGMSITARRIDALKRVTHEQLVTVKNYTDKDKTGTKVTILIPKKDFVQIDQVHIKKVV
ncbi:tetratricopeptide repeat protein [Flagellimonas meridianipacifica]|uniref:Tetratricopeptide repeat protein n=1 Tax=Flagellimonas meridianipacifica TaxID=1080225 RepID=A0A2T0MCI1_9FLAO|nr:tetratricopeptide repeat protein [Allomuricauda pacifica]PRX55204.1 tetratricopeptide repeat protein [Allomuricauda pacifica]